MRRRRLGLATLIGFILATVFSVAYAAYDRTFQPGPILSAIAQLSFPGLLVGEFAGLAVGHTYTGARSSSFALLVATVFNTLFYGVLAYIGLVIFGIGKDRDSAVRKEWI
jgi:hypothetical protein